GARAGRAPPADRGRGARPTRASGRHRRRCSDARAPPGAPAACPSTRSRGGAPAAGRPGSAVAVAVRTTGSSTRNTDTSGSVPGAGPAARAPRRPPVWDRSTSDRPRHRPGLRRRPPRPRDSCRGPRLPYCSRRTRRPVEPPRPSRPASVDRPAGATEGGPMAVRFVPPPGWPVPEGFTPTTDWHPDPSWPPPPPGSVFWEEAAEPAAPAPVPAPPVRRATERLPAGAVPTRRSLRARSSGPTPAVGARSSGPAPTVGAHAPADATHVATLAAPGVDDHPVVSSTMILPALRAAPADPAAGAPARPAPVAASV